MSPPVLNNETVSFLVPSNAVDGDVVVFMTNGGSKTVGNLLIKRFETDCSSYDNSSPDEDGNCICDPNYQWNSTETACVTEVASSEPSNADTNVNSLTDSDSDGTPDVNDYNPTVASELITKQYSFQYKMQDENYGKTVLFTITIPEDLYLFYKNKNHIFDSDYNNLSSFVTYEDVIIEQIVDQANDLYENYNLNPIALLYQLVGEIVYTNDISTGWDEYPRYPVETLFDGEGDCEDSAFLVAALFKKLGITPVLILFDNHLGIAPIVTKDIYDDVVYKYGQDFLSEINDNLTSNNRVIYLETTGGATWGFGEMPESLRGKEYTPYTLEEYKHTESSVAPSTSTGSYNPTKKDTTLISRLVGYILLQAEDHGEAWYVNPADSTRYYMKDGATAYEMMRYFSLGISDADLAKIPSVEDTTAANSASNVCSTNSLANSVRGKILLQVEQHGEAWYVDPDTCNMIYMKDGDSAYTIMRFLSLGITNDDLSKIPSGEI